MKKIILAVAATAIAGGAYAGDKADSTSDRTPGHQMQQDKAAGKDIDKGASTYAPGQQMQDDKAEGKDIDRGASKYTPSRDNSGASGSSTGE
jgi:hypothetical protein